MIKQRDVAPEFKMRGRKSTPQPTGELQQQRRLRRSMHDQPRITLDARRIRPAIMNTASVEDQRRITEQDGRIRLKPT